MKRAIWLSLGIYFFLLLLLASSSLRILLLTLTVIGISIAALFLYKIIESEVFFHLYNFIAVVALPVALEGYNPYSWVTIALAYALLALLLLHIYLHRFFQRFGMIKRETVVYVLLSLPLSFLSAYIFFHLPIGYGFWGIVGLGMMILLLLYFLVRPKSEESSNTP